jgi:uncharacterized protein YcbK (DUF882 family)
LARTHKLLALLLALGAPVVAHAGKDSKSGKSSKKKHHSEPVLTGALVPLSRLRSEPLPRPSGNLVVEPVNFGGERVEVNIYNPDGSFNEESLDKLYHAWRCRRTGTEKPIDPHLFELLSIIHDHFGKPLQLVSGFRNQEHTSSFHFHGSASDIRIAGVDDRELHEFATSLDVGGMGIGKYPRAHFVHVDVRPEPSYRWTDRSPPGENMGHKKKSKKHRNA